MDTPNPLNPQSLPSDSTPAQAADTAPAEAQAAQAKPARRKRSQQQRPRTRRTKRKLSVSFLKARLQARLGRLDNARLKQVLIACGIAAALVVAIFVLIKSIPVGLAILAIVGLGVVVRFLEELRHLPIGVGTL